MTTVADTFSGSGNFSANWGAPFDFTFWQQTGGQASVATGNDKAVFWTANSFTGDQFAEIVVKAHAPGGYWGAGPVIKGNSSSLTQYFATYSASRIFVQKGSAGGTTIIDTNDVVGWGNSVPLDSTIRLEMAGNVISLKMNGVTIATYTDGTPLTGTLIGLMAYYSESTWRGDNFAGGDLTGGGGGGGVKNELNYFFRRNRPVMF